MGEEGISLGTLADSALEGVISEAGGMALNALLGEGGGPVDLSEAAYDRIRDIFRETLNEAELEEEISKTKSILEGLFDAANDPNVNLEDLRNDALNNMVNISGIIQYRGTDAYWAAAAQALLIYRLIYDRSPQDGKAGAARNIVEKAELILTDTQRFEDNLLAGEGLEVFSTFKRYTFCEEPYADPANSPLSYMGLRYRENLQRVLATIDKFDDSKTKLNQLHHPRYLINFFDFQAIKDKVLLLWDASECDPGNFRRRDRPNPGKAWICFVANEYKPIGDLFRSDDSDPHGLEPITIPYVKAIGEGRLARPKDYIQVWRDHGSGNPRNMSGWNPVPPEGFAMMASVTSGHQDQKPDNRCICVLGGDVEMRQTNNRTWNDYATGAVWDGSTWDHPEPAFGRRGIFIMQRSHSWPNTEVGVFTKDAVTGLPLLGMTRPGRPDFDPGNWTQSAGAYGTSGRWSRNFQVRYRIAFYGGRGTVLGPWWHPTNWPGSDADGYYPANRAPQWACPMLINISTDPSGLAQGRIIYRQFAGRDVETVAVIKNNTQTIFNDEVDIPPFGPPASAPDFDPSQWATGSPVSGSQNWVSGFKVRYAVSFYTAGEETPMGPWWRPTNYPGSDSDGYYPGDGNSDWAFPMLISIPVDSTHTATGRRIYRQFYDAASDGWFGTIQRVGEISDNERRIFSDQLP